MFDVLATTDFLEELDLTSLHMVVRTDINRNRIIFLILQDYSN